MCAADVPCKSQESVVANIVRAYDEYKLASVKSYRPWLLQVCEDKFPEGSAVCWPRPRPEISVSSCQVPLEWERSTGRQSGQ